MSKSYKNAFYSNCLDIYTSLVYGKKDNDLDAIDECDMGLEVLDQNDPEYNKRVAIYNKFIDLYGLYYKNEEFIISINTVLLTWQHDKMPITISIINNNKIKCPKYPLYNLSSIKEFIFTEPINTKFCNDLIAIMYLGGYVNSLYAEKIMIETCKKVLDYNLQPIITI